LESNMNEAIFEYLHSCAFQKSPLARSAFGEMDTLKAINRDQIVNYVNVHFTGPRIVVTANGAVNHDEVVQLTGKYFDKIPSGFKYDYNNLGKMDFVGSEIRVRDDEMHDAHVAIAFKGINNSDPNYYKFQLFQILSGSWDKQSGGGKNLSSRVAERVAHENLALSYETFNFNYSLNGIFGINAVIPHQYLDQCTYSILNEWMKIGKYLTKNELERAKNKLKTNILLQWNRSNSICEELGRQIFSTGNVTSLTDILSQIDSITLSDFKCTLREYINDVDPAVVGIGSIEDLPDYLFIRGRTYWYRW